MRSMHSQLSRWMCWRRVELAIMVVGLRLWLTGISRGSRGSMTSTVRILQLLRGCRVSTMGSGYTMTRIMQARTQKVYRLLSERELREVIRILAPDLTDAPMGRFSVRIVPEDGTGRPSLTLLVEQGPSTMSKF